MLNNELLEFAVIEYLYLLLMILKKNYINMNY